MNQEDPNETLSRIRERRVSAIIRTRDEAAARDAMSAAVAGGFRTIEFTLTTPGALDLISEFSSKGDVLVGAGTVLSPQQADAAVKAGARFLVSPVCDADVIARAGELGVVIIPGTFTATEMQVAHRLGADMVKLFPAPADVAGYIRAVLGPLPHLRIFPTAGVTLDNVVDVLEAGAAGAGFVRSLFDPELMSSRDYSAIEARAAAICRRVA